MREEPLLRRIDNGRTESGKPLELKDRVAIWEAGRDVRPPGGESLVDLGQRVAGLVQALHRRTSGTGIVLVTHAEVIGAYLGHLRDVPGADRHPPGIPLASISAVEIPRAGAPRILFVKYEAKLP
jgi:probable phosphoglycerate mutase